MGRGEPMTPRPHDEGGIVIEVAAADHLMKVEAERDAYRGAIEAIPRHEQHVCNVKACSGICTRCWHPWPCATERAHRLIEDAG